MKTLAFLTGLCLAAVGVAGLAAPSILVWTAQRVTSPAEWYGVAALRVVVGVLLLVVAGRSRAPGALRLVALVPLVAGLATPLVGVERARGLIEWWSAEGTVRLSVIPLLLLGGVIAYACAPDRAPGRLSVEGSQRGLPPTAHPG